MKPKTVLLLLIGVVMISGCVQQPSGKIGEGLTTFNYTMNNKTYETHFYTSLASGMDWIRSNTPEQATFLSWWDYGHMIRGVAKRDSIIFAPSRQILNTVAKYAMLSEEELRTVDCPDCNPHEKILDVAKALVTENPDETVQIMKKYNATYVLVSNTDEQKAWALFDIAGKDYNEYLRDKMEFTESGRQTTLCKFLENRIERFSLVFEDMDVKIYEMIA